MCGVGVDMGCKCVRACMRAWGHVCLGECVGGLVGGRVGVDVCVYIHAIHAHRHTSIQNEQNTLHIYRNTQKHTETILNLNPKP